MMIFEICVEIGGPLNFEYFNFPNIFQKKDFSNIFRVLSGLGQKVGDF
jgi:hypothetical protein